MEIVVAGFAVIAATMVVFAYLGFIWWLDRYEREPFWMVLLTFLYGAIFGIACGCTFSALPAAVLANFGEAGNFLTTVVVAPVVEEFTKGFVFFLLIWSRHFDNETDGLIYGAATGLGFAAVENLLYFTSAASMEALMTMVFLRTMFTALVHCISSATLGMSFGYFRRVGAGPLSFFVIFGGYLLAVTNHAVWNTIASTAGFAATSSAGAGAALLLVGCSLVVVASLVMFGLTQFSLDREHKLIRKYLAAEAELGTLPVEHAAIIPYWLRRRRGGWLPSQVPRAEYVKFATLLAFRQHQLSTARGSGRKDELVKDIAEYRQRLRQMLG